MQIETIRAAAKRHGLTVTNVTEAGDGEDGEITLSNGVGIQVSDCGTPVGVTGEVSVPEWTLLDKYWEPGKVPTADGIMLAAQALRKRMDDHITAHTKKEASNG